MQAVSGSVSKTENTKSIAQISQMRIAASQEIFHLLKNLKVITLFPSTSYLSLT